MRLRCPNCNKFRSEKDVELSADSAESEIEVEPATRHVTLTIACTKACPECSEPLATAKVEIELDLSKAQWDAALGSAEWEAA